MGYRVAVVGATGNVGREMLTILEELKFPVEKIHAIASRNSIGLEVEFGDRILKCQDIEKFDDPAEQRYRSIGIDVVGAIAGRQARIVVDRQCRGDVLQRIVQAEPDHVACICIGGNRQSEVCTGVLERVDDDTGGIG